jgi:hypothetical protein
VIDEIADVRRASHAVIAVAVLQARLERGSFDGDVRVNAARAYGHQQKDERVSDLGSGPPRSVLHPDPLFVDARSTRGASIVSTITSIRKGKVGI